MPGGHHNRPFIKPHAKPFSGKPDFTKPDLQVDLCGPRFGIGQILNLLKGGGDVACTAR